MDSIILIIISVGLFLGVLIAIRELYLWYTKTNTIIKNQEETIRLLKIIAENTFNNVNLPDTLDT